jgi:hypothetical protein
MTEPPKNSILLLSPGRSQARAIANWIKRTGKHFRIVGGNLVGLPRSRARQPFQYTVDVSTFSDLDGYEFIIPAGSKCTSFLVANRGGFRVGKVFFAAENLRVYDKVWLYDFSQSLGVSVPDTWNDFDSIPDNGCALFYKPRREGTGGPRRPTKNKNALPFYVRNSNFLFQEYVPGREVYGFGFIAKGGEPIVTCQHLEIASLPLHGGSAVAVYALDNQRIEELSCKLLRALDYEGWGLVEFMYCHRRKDFVLMEINAKWWASLEFALRREPAFGRLLFGIDGVRENLPGLFWPDRYLSSLGGNLSIGIMASKKLPWAQSIARPLCKQMIAGVIPASWIDLYREKKRITRK